MQLKTNETGNLKLEITLERINTENKSTKDFNTEQFCSLRDFLFFNIYYNNTCSNKFIFLVTKNHIMFVFKSKK